MLNQNPVDGKCAASSVLTRFHAAISYLTGGEMIVDHRRVSVLDQIKLLCHLFVYPQERSLEKKMRLQ